LDDITTGTRALIREEIKAAQQETWDRAQAALPGLALLGLAAVFGGFSAAAAFRCSMRVFDKAAPPATAAMLAAATFGAGAVGAGVAGVRWLRESPSPAPVDTMRQFSRRVRAAGESWSRARSTRPATGSPVAGPRATPSR
jgi:hypothetical protein